MKTAALVLLALLPAPLAAQGLGDAAAKERQRRGQQSKQGAAKVFTDTDLPSRAAPPEPGGEASTDSVVPRDTDQPGPEGSAGPVIPRDTGQPGPEGSATADPLDKERQERRLLEAEWRVRFANAREQVAVAEAACWQEVVRTELYQGVWVPMKVKEFVETEEFRRSKRALADLQEEFRRTGLPPGWAREN
jgi:hypothetical protein